MSTTHRTRANTSTIGSSDSRPKCFGPWLNGTRLLELGCATGELASLLAPLRAEYVIVEGSHHNVALAKARVPDATFVCALWEDYEPIGSFTDVVLCNALEHFAEPVELFQRVAQWLAPGGRVHIVVPNGLSLHRLIGVELGLQPDPIVLTADDVAQGHCRNYTLDALLNDVRAGGLGVLAWEPIFLKVLPNRAMLDWSWDTIQAMHRVARRLPEHAAELYIVATIAQ